MDGGTRRWIAIATLAVATGALAGVVQWWSARAPVSACEHEVRFGDRHRGIALCLQRYDQGRDDRDLVWAAKGYMYVGEVDEADKLATRLLAGPRYGDAHAILSYVALRRGAVRAARMHAVVALVAHTLAGDDRGRVNDAVSLAQAAWKLGDFMASLGAADEALQLSLRLRDPSREVAAHLARADALRRMGDLDGAIRALDSAADRATTPCEQAWVRLKRGMCRMETRQDSLALSELEVATAANRRCGSADVSTSIAINLAFLLRRKDPAASLARLDEVTRSVGEIGETLLLRGYLAADRSALREAEGYLLQAERLEALDADWPWEIARSRAELSELRGAPSDDAVAESHYRRAIAMVAALRTTARARSAYLVASHRDPYDGLIALLARYGRWRDVLAIMLELDASDMLRATADDVVVRDHASLDIELAATTPAPPPSVDDVLAAWRSRDLVIVIARTPRQIGPGDERAYRLRISGGQVTGEDVGDARMARTWAAELFADPSREAAARALGRMIVPPGGGGGTLHVLALGALGRVPLAALRDDDGALSIARRPLARVLGLVARGPESRGTGPAIVIADPRGDLPSAAAEGSIVAEALGPGTQVSGSRGLFAATRDRLWAARDAALLHVAGHVEELGSWRALRLSDGDVGPAEIVQRGIAPRLAVLAGCGSAAALDEEGWGSIAAALLEAGTAGVIATDRSVDDADSLAVMRALYAQRDWRGDPARALAMVQLALEAATPGKDATRSQAWVAFSVLVRPPAVPSRALRYRVQ